MWQFIAGVVVTLAIVNPSSTKHYFGVVVDEMAKVATPNEQVVSVQVGDRDLKIKLPKEISSR